MEDSQESTDQLYQYGEPVRKTLTPADRMRKALSEIASIANSPPYPGKAEELREKANKAVSMFAEFRNGKLPPVEVEEPF